MTCVTTCWNAEHTVQVSIEFLIRVKYYVQDNVEDILSQNAILSDLLEMLGQEWVKIVFFTCDKCTLCQSIFTILIVCIVISYRDFFTTNRDTCIMGQLK